MIILHQNDPKGYGALAPLLVDRGYIPIPCQGKRPLVTDWQNMTPERSLSLVHEFPDANVGIDLGDKLAVLDIDIKDHAAAAGEVAQVGRDNLSEGAVITRTGVTSLKIFYRTETGIKKRKLRLRHGNVETLGKGQQAVVAGTLPCGSEYLGDLPPIDELPCINEELIDRSCDAVQPKEPEPEAEPALVDDPAWA